MNVSKHETTISLSLGKLCSLKPWSYYSGDKEWFFHLSGPVSHPGLQDP